MILNGATPEGSLSFILYNDGSDAIATAGPYTPIPPEQQGTGKLRWARTQSIEIDPPLADRKRIHSTWVLEPGERVVIAPDGRRWAASEHPEGGRIIFARPTEFFSLQRVEWPSPKPLSQLSDQDLSAGFAHGAEARS
jgi:hypothetical protein